MRIWLKKDLTSEQLDELQNGGTRLEEDTTTSDFFVATRENPWQPSFRDPQIPTGFVDRCTVKAKIAEGFREDGLYRLADAELMAHLQIERDRNGILVDADGVPIKSQFVDISAGTVGSVKDIYLAFRDGSLEPHRKWGKTKEKKSVEAGKDLATAVGPAGASGAPIG